MHEYVGNVALTRPDAARLAAAADGLDAACTAHDEAYRANFRKGIYGAGEAAQRRISMARAAVMMAVPTGAIAPCSGNETLVKKARAIAAAEGVLA